MLPNGSRWVRALSPDIRTCPYRLSETVSRIFCIRGRAYLGWPHQAPTAIVLFFRFARGTRRGRDPRLGCRVSRATLFHRLRVRRLRTHPLAVHIRAFEIADATSVSGLISTTLRISNVKDYSADFLHGGSVANAAVSAVAREGARMFVAVEGTQ